MQCTAPYEREVFVTVVNTFKLPNFALQEVLQLDGNKRPVFGIPSASLSWYYSDTQTLSVMLLNIQWTNGFIFRTDKADSSSGLYTCSFSEVFFSALNALYLNCWN